MSGPVIGVEITDPVTGAEMTGQKISVCEDQSLDWGWDDRASETRPGDRSGESGPEEEESSLDSWSDDLSILLSADTLVVEPPIQSTGVASIEREVSVTGFSWFSHNSPLRRT